MSNDAKRFFKRLLPYVVGLVVIDVTLGLVGDRLSRKVPGNGNKIAQHCYRMYNCTADVVLIGPSRCQQHYVTSQLQDSLASLLGEPVSVYNAGIDGTGLTSSLCAIETMLDHHMPRMIVMDVSDHEFREYDGKTLRYQYPFYSINPHVRQYIGDIGWKSRLMAYSGLYRYNIRQLIELLEAYHNPVTTDGYHANRQHLDTTHMKRSPKTMAVQAPKPVDSRVHKRFQEVVDICKQNNIELVVSSSPVYRPTSQMTLTDRVCREYNLPRINMYDLGMFNQHPEFFRDGRHLNDDGAHIFTALFFEQLKPYL